MPPYSRGKRFSSFSKSTPNLRNAVSLEDIHPPSPSSPPNHPESPPDPTHPHSDSLSDDLFALPYATSDSSETDSFDDTTTTPSAATLRPLYSQISRSQSYLGPPFYNRPPTPLPPSPSLTSLLRPPFSTHTSRPATPESSDNEGAAAHGLRSRTATAADTVAASARAATTVPRASPKVPTYEYYGFVLYLGSSAAFALYLLWSYLPTPFLHRLGIYYYPDRWWSLAVPGWIVMGIVYIYVALACYNTEFMTLKVGSLENIVDEAADVAVVDGEGRIVRRGKRGFDGVEVRGDAKGPVVEDGARGTANTNGGSHGRKHDGPHELDWRNLWNVGTDAVMDVPIGGVCEVLYGSGRALDAAG